MPRADLGEALHTSQALRRHAATATTILLALAGGSLANHDHTSTASAAPPAAVPAAIAAPVLRDNPADLITHKRELAGRSAREERPSVAPPASIAPTAAARHAQVRTTREHHRAAPARQRAAPPAKRPAGQRARRGTTVAVQPVAVVPAVGDRAAVINFALAQLGKPYVWAAAGPNAYDCSGLVLAAYRQIGVRLPHQTGSMIRYGTPVSRGQLQPGDIVFPSPGHVAIYLGGGRIVHAPHAGDHVRIAPLSAFYAARRL